MERSPFKLALERAPGRIRLAAYGFIGLFAAIAMRLITFGFESVEPRATTQDSVTRMRPDIVDRNGILLAKELKAFSVYAEPRRIIDIDEAAQGLAEVFDDLDPPSAPEAHLGVGIAGADILDPTSVKKKPHPMSPVCSFPRLIPFGHLAVIGISLLALTLAGCVSTQPPRHTDLKAPHPTYVAMYGPQPNEKFPLPATDISTVDPQFLRREVDYVTPEQPGTIVVDTTNRHLYLVRENGRAIRYGIGVGAEGMKWAGRAQVGRKAEWPRWTPTAAMIKRDPERNRPWASGMPPGPNNPLGPRALYLFQAGRDTLYRIHGTTEPDTIGEAVSSGCIRMLNPDILDLYSRVPVGAPVVVLPDTRMADEVTVEST